MWQSILAVEVDSLLIGLAMPIAVALIVGGVALARRRNHKSVGDTVVDIKDTRANRVPVSHWEDRFDAIHREGDRILDKLDQTLGHQNEMLQELAVIKVILMSGVERRETL